MNDMFGHIANIGFPIVISVYLLVRIEGKLENLTISIKDLSKSIDLLSFKSPKGM